MTLLSRQQGKYVQIVIHDVVGRVISFARNSIALDS